jgi:hypothetical protein
MVQKTSKELRKRSARRRAFGGNIAEFGPALLVLFLVIIFPLLNLMGFACGVATATLIANQCACSASVSQTYTDALTAASNTAMALITSPLGKFAGLQPLNGYQGSGVDLYVAATNTTSNKTTVYGPNTAVPGPIDTSTYIYEYEARVNYAIGPFLSMAGNPFVGNIPMIGKPANFQLTVQKSAEYPDGLTGGGAAAGAASGGGGAGSGTGSGTSASAG